jgi:hypothetical protein
MTNVQLELYYKLRDEGKTHWEALGIIYDVQDP